MFRPSRKAMPDKLTSWAMVVCGGVISIALGLMGWKQIGPFGWADRLFLDEAVVASARPPDSAAATVVDIDDRSLAAVGQWPWPRYRVASLIQAIDAAGPAAIGLDILLPESDRTSLANVAQAFHQDFGVNITITGAPPGLSDNDGYLGSVLGQTEVVGARYLYFDGVEKTALSTPSNIAVTGRLDLLNLQEASGELSNTPAIAVQTRYTGFLNDQPDRNGMIRRVPLLIRYHGTIEVHLALATFLRSLKLDSILVDSDGNGPFLRVGSHSIPIDDAGYALVRFEGPSSAYASLSAVDVLGAGDLAPELRGKTVFVGSSAAGLNDLHSTPFDSQFSGLKILAAVVDGMAHDRFIREPAWGGRAVFAECVLTGLFVSALFAYVKAPLRIVLGTVAALAACVALSLALFASRGIFLSPGAAGLVCASLFIVLSVARLTIERRAAFNWSQSLANARQITMESMAAVAETRDPETGSHIKRTQHYVRAIAVELKRTGHYRETLTDDYIDLLFHSAPLHDIGKVGVPDSILLKPGRLTDEEFVIMKRHAAFGKQIVDVSSRSMTGDNYLRLAGEIASSHHEKWDGTGYPLSLAGQSIPLSGRIMAVADVYDALISLRCYKSPFPHAMATGMMKEERGRTFDPVILDAFFAIEEEILEIAAIFRDKPSPEAEPVTAVALAG